MTDQLKNKLDRREFLGAAKAAARFMIIKPQLVQKGRTRTRSFALGFSAAGVAPPPKVRVSWKMPGCG